MGDVFSSIQNLERFDQLSATASTQNDGKLLVARWKLPFLEQVYVITDKSGTITRLALRLFEIIGLYRSDTQSKSAFRARCVKDLKSHWSQLTKHSSFRKTCRIARRRRSTKPRQETAPEATTAQFQQLFAQYRAAAADKIERLEEENAALTTKLKAATRRRKRRRKPKAAPVTAQAVQQGSKSSSQGSKAAPS